MKLNTLQTIVKLNNSNWKNILKSNDLQLTFWLKNEVELNKVQKTQTLNVQSNCNQTKKALTQMCLNYTPNIAPT